MPCARAVSAAQVCVGPSSGSAPAQGLSLLGVLTASASASLDFTSLIDATYDA